MGSSFAARCFGDLEDRGSTLSLVLNWECRLDSLDVRVHRIGLIPVFQLHFVWSTIPEPRYLSEIRDLTQNHSVWLIEGNFSL